MSDKIVSVRLNQQQIELLDATREKLPGKDRAQIVLHALREYCARHSPEKKQ